MKKTTFVTVIFLALSMAGIVGAEISEPDHILYGQAAFGGVPAETGTLTLTVGDDPTIVASYELGSDPALGSLFALRVALDTVGERGAGTARTGDSAQIFLDGLLAAVAVIGERGTAQLLDADPEAMSAAALSINDTEIVEGQEGVREMLFTVSLSAVSDVDVEAQWTTRSGQGSTGALAGVDFRSAAGLVTIPAGDAAATVTVEVFGDTEPELDEELFVELSQPQHAVLLDPEGRGTIRDDDTPPGLSIDNVTATEPASGETSTILFTVRLSHVWHRDVTFDFAAHEVPGGAVGGSDYLLNPGSGTIPAGDLSTVVPVEILGDGLDEGEELFFVRLQNPAEATLLDAEGQGTIADFARFLVWVEAQANGAAGVDGLAGAFDLAVSPDGRHVYAAGRAQDSLVVFERDASDGRLSFLERYVDGHDGIDGLAGIEAVSVSRDGARVYAAGFDDDAVAVFERDAVTGTLDLLEVERDGAVDQQTGRTVEGLAGATALIEVVSEAGQTRHLYVAGHDDDAVAIFAVGSDGRLRFQTAAVDGVGDVAGLRRVSDLAASPDGAHIYAAGYGDHAVVAFNRNSTDGFLSFLEQQRDGLASVLGLRGAVALAVSADGAHLYAAGQLDSAVVAFARQTDVASPDFGRLDFRQVVHSEGTGPAGLAAVSDLTAVRDPSRGDYLYASGLQQDAILVFERGADGGLSLVESRRDGAGGVDGLDGVNALAVSHDDLSVYAAGSLESAVAVFRRDLEPPSAPTFLTSTSHVPAVPSNDRSLAFSWSGARDVGLGVGEYRLLVDTHPETEPPFGPSATIVAKADDPQEAVIQVPADHHGYFLHLQTCDVARNCTETAMHLGPFHIDTVAPRVPLGVQTTSHGVPSSQPFVEMAWTPPADAGPGAFPSPLAGYAISFSLSPEPECDGELDLIDPSISSTVSPPLPAGDWYFHICAGDSAGNFSPPVTVGPLGVDVDSSPPEVLGIETVAGSPGGALLPGAETPAAITQLVAVFSEILDDAGGGLDPHDVTRPTNYRLLSAGPDSLFDTQTCIGGLQGDDRNVAVDAVGFDALTGRANLLLNGGDSLPLGTYRLLVCDELRDLNGNALDGDADGVAGGSFRLQFTVTRQNLLRNPNFDRSLDGWGLAAEPPVAFSWDDGENVPTSGSLHLQRRTGDALAYVLVQCVSLRGGEHGPPYTLSGRLRLTEINGLESRAEARVELHDQPGCSGILPGEVRSSEPVIGDATGTWRDLTLELAEVPVSAVSAEVSFRVEIPDNFDVDVFFDRLLFQSGDRRAPQAPILTSPSHQIGVFSNDPTVEVHWEGAQDEGVGVKEYHLTYATEIAPFPSTFTTIPHGDVAYSVTSEPLADGLQYVHLRTCDRAERCVTDLLGPFPIDTSPPGSPTELTPTATGNLLEVAWTPAVDPGQGSGLAGYAYAVDSSPTWSCDGIQRAGAESTGMQQSVPTGTWYVHVCAVDAAGNWGLAAHAGPIEVTDVEPPRITRFDTVSSTPGRDLQADDALEVAVTQLVVEFSEAMADPTGDSAVEDVTNPLSYRLLTPGDDGAFDLISCATGDSDTPVPLASVTYDELTRRAALRVVPGESLPAGRYRLLVCGSSGLADLSSNLLNGGVDQVLDFEIRFDNLLQNPSFDDDLGSWVAGDEGLVVFVDSVDEGEAASSGSARADLTDTGTALGQCVGLVEEAALEFRSRARVEGSGAVAMAELTWFSEPDCLGTELASEISVPVSSSSWQSMSLQAMRPDGGSSVLVTLLALPSENGEATALEFDSASLYNSLLFGDGFESGDLLRWSSSEP